MSARNSRKGFTLVEVLAAVSILALAVFVLLDAHYTAMRLHEIAQNSADYRQMLESTVNRAEVEVMKGIYAGAGDFGARHPLHTWSYDAALVGSENVQLYEVNARITGPDDEQTRTFLVYSIVRPENAEGGDGMFKSKNSGAAKKTPTKPKQGGDE